MEEKILLQLSNPFGNKSFPLKYENLPKAARNAISEFDIYPTLSYKNKEVEWTDIVYFRQVKQFRKDIRTKEELDGIIYGV